MKLSKSIVVLSVVAMAVINATALLLLKLIPGGASCQHAELINDCVENSNKISCAFVNSLDLETLIVPAYCESLRFVVFFSTVVCMLIGVISGFVLLFSSNIKNKKKNVEVQSSKPADINLS